MRSISSLLLVLTLLASCARPRTDAALRGEAAIGRYGCGSCHTIDHIPDARGLVGPPLTNIRSRMYVAGMLTNNGPNLARWIQNPHEINDRTAMPNLGVTPQDAADIAAFLYSE